MDGNTLPVNVLTIDLPEIEAPPSPNPIGLIRVIDYPRYQVLGLPALSITTILSSVN